MNEKQIEERKRFLAMQDLVLKIRDLIDDYMRKHYPQSEEKTSPEENLIANGQ